MLSVGSLAAIIGNSMQLPKTRTDIQVRFSDLDFLGHVSNSVYAQYFDCLLYTSPSPRDS